MSDQHYMTRLMAFARKTNKVWPFAAMLVDDVSGDILISATDAAHISPIFHAESHCVHRLATLFPNYRDSNQSLTLYCTSECDPLSMSSVIWANLLGFTIKRIVYAVPNHVLCQLWGWGQQMAAKELNDSFSHSSVELCGPYMNEEAMFLFQEAYDYQQILQLKHPGLTLSHNLEDFYELGG